MYCLLLAYTQTKPRPDLSFPKDTNTIYQPEIKIGVQITFLLNKPFSKYFCLDPQTTLAEKSPILNKFMILVSEYPFA